MAQSRLFRSTFSLAVLAMCSAFFFASVGPSEARPGHGTKRYTHGHSVKHGAHRHQGHKVRRATRGSYRHGRHRAGVVAQPVSVSASTSDNGNAFSSATSKLVAEARRYIGTGNPTSRASLWCARFMNMVLERSGHRGTGSDMARSFASYGKRVSGPQVGAIAVMSRGKRGGHVGVVSGIDKSGNPIVVSGNYGRRVAEAVFSRSSIYAYVLPSS